MIAYNLFIFFVGILAGMLFEREAVKRGYK